MLDNQLFPIIIKILQYGLQSLGQLLATDPLAGYLIATEAGQLIGTDPGTGTILIQQSYQPVQQGANSPPTLYLYKVADKRLGSPHRASCWNAKTGVMDYTETQQYESTFQLTCLSTQYPNNPNQLTASDILNYAAYVMQSGPTIRRLENQGIGILRVMDVRNPYFTDDRERYEAAPSFDFVLTHKQIISSTAPIINAKEFDVIPV